jgi:hypothetical protein
MQQENDRLRARRFQLELERGDRLQRIVDLEAEVHTQEDAMKKAHRDKKRSSSFALGSGTYKKFRFVKKNVPNPSQQSSTGRWTMNPSQSKPSGNFQFRNAQ